MVKRHRDQLERAELRAGRCEREAPLYTRPELCWFILAQRSGRELLGGTMPIEMAQMATVQHLCASFHHATRTEDLGVGSARASEGSRRYLYLGRPRLVEGQGVVEGGRRDGTEAATNGSGPAFRSRSCPEEALMTVEVNCPCTVQSNAAKYQSTVRWLVRAK